MAGGSCGRGRAARRTRRRCRACCALRCGRGDRHANAQLFEHALLQPLQPSRLCTLARRSSRRFSSWRVSSRMRTSAPGASSSSSRRQVQVPGGQDWRIGGWLFMAPDHSQGRQRRQPVALCRCGDDKRGGVAHHGASFRAGCASFRQELLENCHACSVIRPAAGDLCVAGAAAAEEARLVESINAYRGEVQRCGSKASEELPPLTADSRLNLPVGAAGDLQDALSRAGYPMVTVQAITLSGPQDAQAAMQALRESFCRVILDPQFTDIGVSREGRDWRIVVARPLLDGRLGDWQAEGRSCWNRSIVPGPRRAVAVARISPPRAAGLERRWAAPPRLTVGRWPIATSSVT